MAETFWARHLCLYLSIPYLFKHLPRRMNFYITTNISVPILCSEGYQEHTFWITFTKSIILVETKFQIAKRTRMYLTC